MAIEITEQSKRLLLAEDFGPVDQAAWDRLAAERAELAVRRIGLRPDLGLTKLTSR